VCVCVCVCARVCACVCVCVCCILQHEHCTQMRMRIFVIIKYHIRKHSTRNILPTSSTRTSRARPAPRCSCIPTSRATRHGYHVHQQSVVCSWKNQSVVCSHVPQEKDTSCTGQARADTRHKTQDTRHWASTGKHKTQDTRHKTQGTGTSQANAPTHTPSLPALGKHEQ